MEWLNKYEDPYERDSTDLAISYVSFGLTGIMILVGFIVGPEKKERLIAQPPPLPPTPPTEKLL